MFRTFLCQGATEKFADAVKLNDVTSKTDSESKPYESKYKARDIWLALLAEVESLKEQEEDEFGDFLLAALHCKLGLNCCDTEELSQGEDYLRQCIKRLEEKRLDERGCNILQTAYNGMGVLWSLRKNPSNALEHLQKAEELYKEYHREVSNAPVPFNEVFSIPEEDLEKTLQQRIDHFEETYTYTQFYLAQVFTHLGEKDKAAGYCQFTLQRQLSSRSYEHLDWALNAATLSQYYLDNPDEKRLAMARHCLASAEYILSEKGQPVFSADVLLEDSQADADMKEKLPRTWADLYRCWIKYGLCVLETSMNYLIKTSVEEAEEGSHNQEQEDQEPQANGEKDKKPYLFDLELTHIEEKITAAYVKVFDEARKVFVTVQSWISKAKEFYKLDGYCSDYVELVQDHSTAFKLVAFFELSLDRQCKMHKRRIDMLQDTLKELNPQFYLMICRQLMFELAETYMSMLDLKIAIIEESEQAPTPHAVKKINTLAKDGIAQYEKFMQSLKDADGKLPKTYAEENERPALIALFCKGRLYSKFLGVDKQTEIENVRQSLSCYEYLVNYCKENPNALYKVKGEYDVCSEMVELLPKKLDKLLAELQRMQ